MSPRAGFLPPSVTYLGDWETDTIAASAPLKILDTGRPRIFNPVPGFAEIPTDGILTYRTRLKA